MRDMPNVFSSQTHRAPEVYPDIVLFGQDRGKGMSLY